MSCLKAAAKWFHLGPKGYCGQHWKKTKQECAFKNLQERKRHSWTHGKLGAQATKSCFGLLWEAVDLIIIPKKYNAVGIYSTEILSYWFLVCRTDNYLCNRGLDSYAVKGAPSGLTTEDQELEVYGTGVLWVDCQLPPPLSPPGCGVLHICAYLFSVHSIPHVPIVV